MTTQPDPAVLGLAVTPAQRAWLVQYFIAGELCEECFTERWRAEAFVNESSPNQRAKLIPLIAEQDHATLLARVAALTAERDAAWAHVTDERGEGWKKACEFHRGMAARLAESRDELKHQCRALENQIEAQAAIQTALVAALAPEKLQRLGNLIANLAHPKGDHKQNDLEDEAHDLLREIREAALARVAAGKKA